MHALDDFALRRAAFWGHSETILILLRGGADVHAAGDDALRAAVWNGHTAAVRILLDAGADVEALSDRTKRWVEHKNYEEIAKLIKNRGSPPRRDLNERPPHP